MLADPLSVPGSSVPLRASLECRVLSETIASAGGSLADAARALWVSAPHVTTEVNQLETRGLSVRHRSNLDRRVQFLHATRKSAELLRNSAAQMVAQSLLPHLRRSPALQGFLHAAASARHGCKGSKRQWRRPTGDCLGLAYLGESWIIRAGGRNVRGLKLLFSGLLYWFGVPQRVP